jgi:ArsR family transcriptional regulator
MHPRPSGNKTKHLTGAASRPLAPVDSGAWLRNAFHAAMENSVAISQLAALAQDTRLDIFRTLVEYRPNGLAAGRIGQLLELPGATLSFHLNQLKQAGLVSVERQGRSLIYSADTDAVDRLTLFLQENCCSKSEFG